MVRMGKRLPASALALALSLGTASAAVPEGCSSDAFAIDGSQVTVLVCIGGPFAMKLMERAPQRVVAAGNQPHHQARIYIKSRWTLRGIQHAQPP